MPLPIPILLDFVIKLLTEDNLITFGAVGLIIYIVALILSKTTKCIIVWNWWDLIILAIPGIILILSLYLSFNNEGEEVTFINNIALNILFVVSFLATMMLSIVANLKHSNIASAIIFCIIALLAKVVISILIPVFLILFLGALNSGKKDNRYKSGRKGNQNIIIAGIIAAIAALLIGSLIKNGNEEE
ncbi:MAG: hypothetical protein Ta2A_19040 [Treponemataceae bacterium]|nr:MAG: hypothetical protein Ta2A_19040 [Treponemataceae bacterium]